MEHWGTRWAREYGHIKQEMAPGHSRRRCCYVDFLNTGPAVAATLRRKVGEISEIRRMSNITIVEIVTKDGRALGAVGLDVIDGGRYIAGQGRHTGGGWFDQALRAK